MPLAWGEPKSVYSILISIAFFFASSALGSVIFKTPFLKLASTLSACTPTGSWNERWKRLEERDGELFDAKPQCNLVRSDCEISVDDEDKWFGHSKNCEKRIGVPESIIDMHDSGGGSYRTFHDHMLMELFDEKFLNMLSSVRLTSPSADEIDKCIEAIRAELQKESVQ